MSSSETTGKIDPDLELKVSIVDNILVETTKQGIISSSLIVSYLRQYKNNNYKDDNILYEYSAYCFKNKIIKQIYLTKKEVASLSSTGAFERLFLLAKLLPNK